jgi:hypothetical protein
MVLMIFWLIAEPVRLAAGWYGNLQENVRLALHAAPTRSALQHGRLSAQCAVHAQPSNRRQELMALHVAGRAPHL